jgi:Ca2+-binding EF-hand superfamily protein
MKKAVPDVSDEKLLEQFDIADLNGDEKLIFEEFEVAIEKAKELAKLLDPNVKLFNLLDTTDPKEKLSYEEWNVEIKKAKPDISNDILEKLFKEVDTDQDTFVDLQEFKSGIENAKRRAENISAINKDPE